MMRDNEDYGGDDGSWWHLLSTWAEHLMMHSPQFYGYRPAHLIEAHPLPENSNGNRATHREEGASIHWFHKRIVLGHGGDKSKK